MRFRKPAAIVLTLFLPRFPEGDVAEGRRGDV
jgi:hypothetical protein